MKKIYTSALVLCLGLLQTVSFSQNGLSFDGTNDYINCGRSTSLNITGTAITMEAWIYPTSWRTNIWEGNIISKEGTGTGYMLRVGNNGRLNMNVGNGPGPSTWHELTSSTSVLTLNTWQHVAGTYDGSFLRLYVNGVVTDSIAKTVTMTGSNSIDLLLGTSPYDLTRVFPGRIDEIRIWNVARTKAQINLEMNNELCTVPSSVKAYYTFNQGIAAGTNTAITTATDISGNSNTGTLTNFSLTGATSNWILGKSLTPGTVVSSISVSACGSYTMPDGRIITTPGLYYDTLPSSSPCDSLIGYTISFPPAIIRNTVNDSSCVSYTTSMGTVITTSGTYYDTISTSSGCDTTVRYNVVISGAVDDSIYRVGTRITSFDTWANHQWVRCDSNYKPIPGATNRFYIYTQDGDYGVIVTRGSCVDTSECITVNFAGINENLINDIQLFPNPTNGIVSIITNSKINSIALIDVTGKTVLNSTNVSSVDLSTLPKGVYFAKIKTDNGTATKKIIRE